METILYDTLDIGGSDFIMTISQYGTGSVVDDYMTEIKINKFDSLGNAKDQKIFVFTKEEFECFINCLVANDKRYNDNK